MPAASQAYKFAAFQQLHARPGAFVIPNPWDAGTARILTSLGFEALATTSAGLAFALGRRDSSGSFSREDILSNARAIVEATHLPVSADLEDGFGVTPEACASTIIASVDVGLVGGSIEDATGDDRDPIFAFNHAVERVAAAAEASRGRPFLLTARAENFLWTRPDLDDTIRRLQAFAKAGGDVLYAPGLPGLHAIRTVCAAVDKPVNVVMGLQGAAYTVADLEAAGVKRISVGGSFARAALGGFFRAAQEVKERGTFTYASAAMSNTQAAGFMAETKRPDHP
jgi:2-methylisocitrate lyase-like PEP mutase family enzyme